MIKRLLCLMFGHNWLYADGYSTSKRHRLCIECHKLEKLQ